MHADFWHERWAQGRIGFHLPGVNPLLEKYFAHLDKTGTGAGTVFMPMCGKSVDITWLAGRTGRVIGVEISQLAVSDFFAEQQLQAYRKSSGALQWWCAGNIELACGDFFTMTATDLEGVDMVYDRAALVALPADMRRDYAAHLSGLLAADTRMLLITLEYDQSRLDGPPFSVPEEEVRDLYANSFEITLLESLDCLEERFRERGLSAMQEKAYILRRRDNA